MYRLLIDTDIGGDIDDALALAMALNEPEIDIQAVTNVYLGNEWRGNITKNMLRAFDREIPVFFGAERPLCGTWGEASDHPNDAVSEIIRLAQQPLTILAIGPMTNIALALLLDPGIAKNLTIYAMGGCLNRAIPEWNIKCDPESAGIVLSSGAGITLVPLDVTEQCTLSKEQSLALCAGEGKKLAFLRGEMDRFLHSFSFLPTLHDPLALLCLLEEDICQYEMKHVRVETTGEMTRGVTDCTDCGQNLIRCATRVDALRAVQKICSRVRNEQIR